MAKARGQTSAFRPKEIATGAAKTALTERRFRCVVGLSG
jgi:hypothetical protein